MNNVVTTYLTLAGKNPAVMVNEALLKFEGFMEPLLNENGFVNGEKLSQVISLKFNKTVPIPDFRLVDVTRGIEPWLLQLGSMIQ